MPGLEQRLSLSMWEDPSLLYGGGGRCALCVTFGGGETPVVVSGVLGDINVASEADVLHRRQCCEPIVLRGLRARS